MFNGLKEKRQLALYVALGLSTGGGLLFHAPAAYAADVTIPSSDTSHRTGVNGTTETGNADGNNVTIGESGAAGPDINGDVVGGSATAGNVANNKVTINSISLGSGKVIYGGKRALCQMLWRNIIEKFQAVFVRRLCRASLLSI